MIESIFLKGLMQINQVYQKKVIFVTIGILKILVLSINLPDLLSNAKSYGF